MRHRLTIVLLAVSRRLALLAAVPAGAGAQAGGSRFPTVLLSAKTTQGRFQGASSSGASACARPGLAVFGRLNGTLRDRRYPTTQRVRNRPFSFTIALARVPVARAARASRSTFAPRIAPIVGLAADVRAAHARPAPAPRHRPVDRRAAVRRLRRRSPSNAPPAVTVHLLNALRLQYA